MRYRVGVQDPLAMNPLRAVTTVAVALVVLGAFDLALGLALSGVALFTTTLPPEIPWESLPVEPRAAVVVFGPLLVLAGALKVAAGIRNYGCRDRRLGILALASCAFSMSNGVCCLPAAALLVCGIAVYVRPEVDRAFRMGAQGLSREWIEASLANRRTSS